MKITDVKKIDDVGYSGSVEIGIIRKDKKYPKIVFNNGKIALFKFLCNCLAAKINPDVAATVSNRPMCLNLMNGSSSILSYGIPISDIIIESAESVPSCSITFNFLVPGTTIFGSTITGVQLTNAFDNNIPIVVYAEANLGGDVIKVNQIDTNIYVSWTLTIMNR